MSLPRVTVCAGAETGREVPASPAQCCLLSRSLLETEAGVGGGFCPPASPMAPGPTNAPPGFQLSESALKLMHIVLKESEPSDSEAVGCVSGPT